MTTSWYIARNKQKFGPFSTNQLQQLAVLGLVKAAEYVLPEGGTKWVAAHSVQGLLSGVETSKRYWVSVGGNTLGPLPAEQIRAGLLCRRLTGETRVCPEDSTTWAPLARMAEFLAYLPVRSRDSRAHLGQGSRPLHLTEEEAELHLAGKQGDRIAPLLSTLFDMRRRYADNATMLDIIDKNIHALKVMREGKAWA
jgi:hypothetical protein